jgi:NAD(P)-dependent dehydrogenase (short-subunit alcohol dehydrogenase family)
MIDLTGKTILLTGTSSGIGAVTARVLGEAGASLIAHYAADRAGAEQATSGIPADRKLLLSADFTDPGAGRSLWSRALAWHGRIDVLVNNAAVMLENPIDGPDAEWDAAWSRNMQVNVIEPASLIRGAVRHYRAGDGGIIISMSSWAGQQGSAIPQLSAYAATKAAIKAVTQTVARVHAKDGVLAYVVAPGIVRTQMSEISATFRGGEDAVKAILPLGDMVPPTEVGNLIAFLSSGLCRHLSGATLDVNGAAYVRLPTCGLTSSVSVYQVEAPRARAVIVCTPPPPAGISTHADPTPAAWQARCRPTCTPARGQVRRRVRRRNG